MSDTQSDLLTLEEAADYLRTPANSLRAWRNRGKGPIALRPGRQLLYRRADLDAFLNDLAREARAERTASASP